jgi:HAD superfamily hydrolase (TIGR01509 family)
MTPDIRVLAFDCDGVLFDTEEANKAFYNRILLHFGRPPLSEEQFVHAQMHTVDEALANLFPDPGSYEKAQAYRKRTGYDPFIPYMKMEPDLIALLNRLKGRLHLAVATNRSDTMQKVLEIHGISNYFDIVVTALDVENPKPHPEPLERILSHFGIAPGEMLYVGDSELDALAADAAGVIFAACSNPELSARFHIERLSELEDIVSPREKVPPDAR